MDNIFKHHLDKLENDKTVTRRKPYKNVSDEQIEKYYNAGVRISTMGKELGMSVGGIVYRLKVLNLYGKKRTNVSIINRH
jgi:hypothetical protein